MFSKSFLSLAGLEEHLMQGGHDEVDTVAELASAITPSYLFKVNYLHTIRSSSSCSEVHKVAHHLTERLVAQMNFLFMIGGHACNHLMQD